MSKSSQIDETSIRQEVERLKALLDDERKKPEGFAKELASVPGRSQSFEEAEKQFFANLDHEIRNLINVVVGLINLLYDTNLNVKQFEYLNDFKYSADVLMSLIADVLDLSKIRTGKLELNEKAIDITEAVSAIVQAFSFKTQDQDVQFSIDFEEELKGYYFADPTVFHQIFLHLISNAVKFTRKGTILIHGSLVNKNGNVVTAQFNVTYTGVGIPKSQFSEIIEVFRYGRVKKKLKYGSITLGLSIVKILVSLYHGDIRVGSKEGNRTTFTFTLELRKADVDFSEGIQKEQEVGTAPNLDRVLVVEDNKINQQYLTWLLGKWSINYDVAKNGKEALDLTEKHRYDLILMDVRMPVMDGYEATIRLRKQALNPNQKVPIVALTASALVDERKKALEVGMNSHLPKPFSPDQLRNTLYEIEAPEEPVPDQASFQFSKELNTEYLNRFYGNDIERARLMFEIFLKNIDRQLDQLHSHLKQLDSEAFAALAHRIKPTFAMVGLPDFGEEIKKMEKQCKEQQFEKTEQRLIQFVEVFSDKKLFLVKELDNICNFLNQ